jgi:hypothetical protein
MCTVFYSVERTGCSGGGVKEKETFILNALLCLIYLQWLHINFVLKRVQGGLSNCIIIAWYVSGISLSSLKILTHLILIITLWSKNFQYLLFLQKTKIRHRGFKQLIWITEVIRSGDVIQSLLHSLHS